ncbi:MAG: hypothetical protein WC966_02200 [Bradymonadales bacterium]
MATFAKMENASQSSKTKNAQRMQTALLAATVRRNANSLATSAKRHHMSPCVTTECERVTKNATALI